MDTSATGPMQYVYDFARLDRVPDGSTSLQVTAKRLLSGPDLARGKSSTVGAVLTGERIVCTLGCQSRGTGAKAHSHPNEQFNYILRGAMMSDIEGDRVFALPGTILHQPGSVVHTGLACPDEDLHFLALKDTRSGIVGPPVDGRYDGPNCFPGFGSRVDEPPVTTAQAMAEAKRLPPGPGRRYVHPMFDAALPDPGAPAGAALRAIEQGLPAGVSGRRLSGERLEVCALQLERGSALAYAQHPGERFVFVVAGRLRARLDGAGEFEVPPLQLLHVPAGVGRTLATPEGARILIAQSGAEPFAP